MATRYVYFILINEQQNDYLIEIICQSPDILWTSPWNLADKPILMTQPLNFKPFNLVNTFG
jgi:hypothetical protein